MAYSDFSLPDIEQRLGCTIREHPDLFAGVTDAVPSELPSGLRDGLTELEEYLRQLTAPKESKSGRRPV